MLNVTQHLFQLNSSEHNASFCMKAVSCSPILLHPPGFLCKASREPCFPFKFSPVLPKPLARWSSWVPPFLGPFPGLRSSRSPLLSPRHRCLRPQPGEVCGTPPGSGAQETWHPARLEASFTHGGCTSPSEHPTGLRFQLLTRVQGVRTLLAA